ncbi:chemotaxis protein CheW [Pontibacillus marinus]|uniref:CheW-like domain-containing protein n=1 Tax=Pontibacillus marinus BH030004 = DSM 16465 TaxID=1385511 RepID=A0A0A5GIS0_9BACI|nr:chemotaxis protein CheW [Pontibacillus marinus]KGX91020.1 hypothetical protein N783_13320 [Pontibacillus marinus BH030004 = DSM 16465]
MSRKYVTFIAHNEEFGMPIDYVNYIELPSKVTQIPKSPASVIGISTIRGNVVPIIDLNITLFDKGINLSEWNLARVIGVKVKQEEIGFLVEEAREIIDINEENIQQVNQGGIQYKIANLENGRLILITDPRELINSETFDYIENEMSETAETEEA